jgi:signal transduction histidine kinase
VRRPLDNLASIKLKIGGVIVAAVVTTLVVNELGVRWNYKPAFRAAVAAALALAMVQVLARGMTSPLREMASAARSMARGEHGRRVTATSRDEVGELARAFNAMSAELEELDRLRRDLVANVSHELRTPISALQAVLENLVDGVEPADPEVFRTMLKQVERLGRLVTQLLDLSRLESGAMPLQRRPFPVLELLDDAAEECRLHAPATPVTGRVEPPDLVVDAAPERVHHVVANLLENLVDGVEPADPEVFRTMLKQVERLGRLVTQLLDLSRLESGAMPLQRRPFPVLELLDDAAEECRLHAPATPVTVRVEPPDLVVDADPERVHQVVANLLENAVRHSPPGAAVELSAGRVAANGKPGAVRLAVVDAGPGIPDDEAARVFERFYRADAARASADGGAGLGLAIARWIVDLHGGSIRPERVEPTGCRMVVELPPPDRIDDETSGA